MSRRVLAATAALILAGAPVALPGPAAAQSLTPSSFADAPSWLQDVYAERGFGPVWSDGRRPSRAFEALVRAVADADARGLDPAAYSPASVARLRRESPVVREQGAAMIFAAYALDLTEGRIDPEIEYQPNFEPYRDRKKGELLKAAYETGDPVGYLSSLGPDNFIVERLTEALGRYRDLAARDAWEPLPDADDVLIEEGETHALVPAIRRRLSAEGFETRGSGEIADEGFVSALKAFQRSRSMKEDGVVGPNTIAALNETPRELVDRLEVNIERARWLPAALGDRAAFVNAADYTLRLYEDGRRVDRMPVIVGEAQTQTPIFADTMERVVVNPYWNVPSSILIGEIAPKQLADPSYITSKDFEVLRGNTVISPSSVDWQAAANGNPSFRVRQKAGDTNALGRIKFLFPNKYAVYLHDTPADSLFERDVRTFSHGCIRVEDPLRFGAWITGESERALRRMIDSRERIVIETPPVPVYITYFTAWAEPDGDVTFPRDVYDRDARVLAKLES